MHRKLFVTSYQRPSRRVVSLLQDANIQYTTVDVDSTFHGSGLLKGLTGEYRTPVLFVDGVKYVGVGEIRDDFLAS